eukprot:maker-scaffold589_size129586-snap-gene-0.52 protein:Tk07347 transcript:maker-scaffold589_size129586-snap-gene-0.52-mRNA-1 annotation:"alba-like protein c9orf23-like protein"
MENYTKGPNVEFEDTLANVGLPGLPTDITWMRLKAGSKLRNMIGYAKRDMAKKGCILISGYGAALTKAISLGEMLKQAHPKACQYNKIAYKTFEEHWDPKTEDLDPMKVVREVPQIFIVLAREPRPELGLEPQKALGDFLEFGQAHKNHDKPLKKRGNRQASANLGLSNAKKYQGPSGGGSNPPRNGPRRPKPNREPVEKAKEPPPKSPAKSMEGN